MSKQKIDKLSLDMIECKKAGFGCHYGAWKATQDPVKAEKKEIPEGWNVCAECGAVYKPTIRREQLYCDSVCQRKAYSRAKYLRSKEAKGENNES